jgi:hypothetical protein
MGLVRQTPWKALTAVLAALVAGCCSRVDGPTAPRSPVHPTAPNHDVTVAPHPAPPVAVTLLDSELLIGSRRGLEIRSVEGQLKRLVSAGPALYPRWVDAGSVLVLVPAEGDDLRAGGELQQIQVDNGARTHVATLPPFQCAPRPNMDEWVSALSVTLQDDDDFEVDSARGLACLRLLDRNINMSTILLDVRVDLRTHGVERWLSLGSPGCIPPDGVQSGEPPSACHSVPAASGARSAPVPIARPFGLEQEGEIQETTPHGVKLSVRIAGYVPESLSPSGRWLVLYGDLEEHDYIYRRLVLLDRSDGHVYPIIHPAGPWPAPLRPHGTEPPTIPTPIEGTVQVVGESIIRWIGTSETSERLVVDGSLVIPARGTFALDGQVAR